MNVANFPENLQLMQQTGFTLTDLESALIENSLTILQSDNKFNEIFFFGRIETSGPGFYYIAFGYGCDILKERKFFYSLNAYEWVLMPPFRPKLWNIARNARSFFRGDPAHVEEVCMPPRFIPDDEEVFLACHRSPKKIKEDDRLACVVHSMMFDCAIVPRGVLYHQPNHCVTFNPCFRGLTHLDASLLINFQLFREPINNRNFNITKRENYNYQTDFFDTVDDLVPKKSFSIQINDRDVCSIRSLKWPGMIFLHKLNTPHQGFSYFGAGQENLDLLFMI